MNTYIYPQNLRATAHLWLWSLKDFTIISLCALVSILLLTQIRLLIPLAVTLLYAFLTIRMEDMTLFDYIRYATRYFISTQQLFYWRIGYGRET